MKILSTVNSRLLAALILLFLVTGLLFLVRTARAQSACAPDPALTTTDAIDKINRCAIEDNIFDDKVFNLNQIAGTTDSLYNLITGKSKLHPETDNITANNGALHASGALVAALYSTPPVSGVQYLAKKFDQLNPVQPVYAQTGTTGFAALRPVEQLWTVFRNISYVGFVIVFVIIGFMVMFRAHISPQAVATVQDSIPRIVIALALVTFSYAIAGLLIDLMFLIMNVVINALVLGGLLDPAKKDLVFERSIFSIFFSAWTDVFGTVYDAISELIEGVVNFGFFDSIADKIFGFFGGTLAALVIGIAMLFIMFRIFIMLLMAYAQIILLTAAAPFFFLFQALPGKNGAGEWFKQIISHIAVFPAVAFMIMLAGIIGGINKFGGIGSTPAVEQPGAVNIFPLLGGDIPSGVVGELIAIGILMMTPQAAELVKNALGNKGPNLGAGAMAGAAAGGAVVGAAASRAGGYAAQHNPASDWYKQRQRVQEEERGIKARRTVVERANSPKQKGGLSREDLADYGYGYKKPD